MARVILANDWFAPGGRYYFRTEEHTYTTIPDELVEFLPPRARNLDAPVSRDPVPSDEMLAEKKAEALAYVTQQAEVLAAKRTRKPPLSLEG